MRPRRVADRAGGLIGGISDALPWVSIRLCEKRSPTSLPDWNIDSRMGSSGRRSPSPRSPIAIHVPSPDKVQKIADDAADLRHARSDSRHGAGDCHGRHSTLIANQFDLISEQLVSIDAAAVNLDGTASHLSAMTHLAGSQLSHAVRAFRSRDLNSPGAPRTPTPRNRPPRNQLMHLLRHTLFSGVFARRLCSRLEQLTIGSRLSVLHGPLRTATVLAILTIFSAAPSSRFGTVRDLIQPSEHAAATATTVAEDPLARDRHASGRLRRLPAQPDPGSDDRARRPHACQNGRPAIRTHKDAGDRLT